MRERTQNTATQSRPRVWSTALLFVLAVGVAGAVMLRVRSAVRCKEVRVTGTFHVSPDTVRAIARLDSVKSLYSIDATLVKDRVSRHPWVEKVRVRKWPNGVLVLGITERSPVALAIDAGGYPAFYVDREGVAMPLDSLSDYDVPLVHGIPGSIDADHPAAGTIRDMLAALDGTDPLQDALISEVLVRADGGVELTTIPTPGRASIRVRLGDRNFDKKLSLLVRFWEQAVIGRPEIQYEWIDLRFEHQVVTREHTEIG